MALIKLDIHNVRNIQKETLHPSPYLNFIYGANASGKSALLEAIYVLGRAKSFRSVSIKPVIRFNQQALVISAQCQQANGSFTQLGIQMDGKQHEIRINQQTTPVRSELAYRLPLQLIHPKSFELLDAGPQLRREFLDWGVFNEEESYLDAWRRCKKALSQRNALLKSQQLNHINVWDKELAYYGTIVDGFRQQYLEKFKPVFADILAKFITLEGIGLKLLPGWDNSQSLADVLADDLSKDSRYGFTHSGPHRADFLLTIDNRLAKDFVSRGQLKLLVMGLKLAQVQLLMNRQDSQVCILIDDFVAELDQQNRAKLLACLDEMQAQVFITGTEKTEFGELGHFKNHKLFHVEHGHVKQI
ncbi:DNA replication/repair protein RecF [Methylosoma difficile]